MSDAKRRSPASRPGKAGESRGRPKATGQRREARPAETRPAPEARPEPNSISSMIVAAAERQSEQRLGFTARRAAILAAVVCVLTLTIAGPVRTFFAQRTEMKQLAVTEAALREQIAELEEQKAKLADPVFIAAQARERLGFVMPGEIPYQVQLPPGVAEQVPDVRDHALEAAVAEPWYTSLWHTIAENPHSVAAPEPAAPAAPPPAPEPGG